MKNTFTDANMPRTSDGRLIAVGVRAGEVANRVITVGSPSRAEAIALLLDQVEHSEHHGDVYKPVPAVFRLVSERGFLTITGRYRGVPVSIISIGMGYPNMDFFVREVRECVDGDLVIVRLGSCGGLLADYPVGTLVIPSASVSVRRNYDYDFLSLSDNRSDDNIDPYEVSKAVPADPELHDFLANELKNIDPVGTPVMIIDKTVNASTDSFYSSQGRQTCFPDHNDTLIDSLVQKIPGLATFEMETFHLLHLAVSWRPRLNGPSKGTLADLPATSSISSSTILPLEVTIGESEHSPGLVSNQAPRTLIPCGGEAAPKPPAPRIRAAAVQMIFAQRRTQDFIDPTQVAAIEEWSGRAILGALSNFHIPDENLHDEKGSVWEKNRLHLN